MGFDPNEYLKEDGSAAFDPHAYADAPLEEVPEVASAFAGAASAVPFAHQIGAAGKTAMDVITGRTDLSDAPGEYQSEYGRLKSDSDETKAANPKSALLGSVAMAPFQPMSLTAKSMAGFGAAKSLGDSSNLAKGDLGGAALDAAKGGAAGLAGYGAGALISKAASPVTSRVADFLRSKAAKLAVKSTGATAAQTLNKLPEDAGEQLLDRGIVGFGDTRHSIADKAAAALDASGKAVGDAADQLDAKGASVDRNSVIKYLKDKIAALSGNEGEKSTVNALKGKIADIEEQIPAESTEFMAEDAANSPPPSQVGFNKARDIRQSLDRGAKWDSNTDAATRLSNREAANAYRSAEEEAANAVDPDLGAAYKQAKTDFHTLSPIQEVAEKRAAAQAAHHGVNLHSLGTGSVGALLGGEEGYRHGGLSGGLAGALAGGLVGPRVTSSAAATTNLLSSLVRSSPEVFGKYASVLTQAAAKSPETLETVNRLLQQQSPEYRQKLMQLQGNSREVAAQKGDSP